MKETEPKKESPKQTGFDFAAEFERFYNYDTQRGTIIREWVRSAREKVPDPTVGPKKLIGELERRKTELQEAGYA